MGDTPAMGGTPAMGEAVTVPESSLVELPSPPGNGAVAHGREKRSAPGSAPPLAAVEMSAELVDRAAAVEDNSARELAGTLPAVELPSPPAAAGRVIVVDTSARGLADTLRELRKAADRAVEKSECPPRQPEDLGRAERLLKGKGEVFEDIALGAAVTVDATMGLVRRHTQKPQETSLGTWAFGRRLQTPSFTTTIKVLAAVVAVIGMVMLADSLTVQLRSDDTQHQLTTATPAMLAGPDNDVLGKLRTKMLSRIAARAGDDNPAAGTSVVNEAADAGSWGNEEAEEMARGLAAWRKVQARRRLQSLRSGDETSLFSLFLLTSAVCSLAFFVFDFVSWDCT